MNNEEKTRYSAVVDHTGKAYIGISLEVSSSFNDLEGDSTAPSLEEGWWSPDKEGEKKLNKAKLGDTVFFHVRTKNIDKETIKLTLRDWDDWINKDDYPKGGPKSITISSNKGFIEFTIPEKWGENIIEDYGDEIELYFDIEYKGK